MTGAPVVPVLDGFDDRDLEQRYPFAQEGPCADGLPHDWSYPDDHMRCHCLRCGLEE